MIQPAMTVPMHLQLLVSAINDLHENEFEEYCGTTSYKQFEKAHNTHSAALDTLVNGNPELKRVFNEYSDSRNLLEYRESHAMFLAGYTAALRAAGQFQLGIQIEYAAYEMNKKGETENDEVAV